MIEEKYALTGHYDDDRVEFHVDTCAFMRRLQDDTNMVGKQVYESNLMLTTKQLSFLAKMNSSFISSC
jgi:hypothetical protein